MAPFTITVRPGQPVLVVQASGRAALADLCAYADFVAGLARGRRVRKAVMNLLAVQIGISFTDHITLGAHAARALRELEQAASAVDAKYRSGTREKAAQNSGLKLRTFTDLGEAIAWVS
ncbi:MAG: hypothetical protein JWP65_1387 [Ramlibacter sp.]|uniref:hypothetical protein n=1 Tax=Ramlibacter sp. TaxID=1917967 RepID=UPI0026086108|nr:hypothetical protein [Ramlibacter sp.]MDB5750966.1 hypothetical protein [Ramlibacter sp.]